MEQMKRLPKRWNELDWQIYEARIDLGLSWRRVGERVGKSHEYCRNRLITRFAQQPHLDADDYRAEELARLESREARCLVLYAKAMAGQDPVDDASKVIKQLNDITKLRSALLGLNKPIKVDVSVPQQSETLTALESSLDAYLAGVDDSRSASRLNP